MATATIQVPVPLLLHSELRAAAKVVWLASQIKPNPDMFSASSLARLTGLARGTVISGITELRRTGWLPPPATAHGTTVRIPSVLVTDCRIGIQARLLYGVLQLVPGFSHPAGKFNYRELVPLASTSQNTLRQALQELAGSRWITVERANRLAVIHFQLGSPADDWIEKARQRLASAKFVGEALMREYLTLLVDSDRFKDNACPDFLTNPQTGDTLEFDRFYPPDVAFEFNGAQHYRPTERFTLDMVNRQRLRDYIKRGICVTRGVSLVTVHPEDLSLDAMRGKIGCLLPLRQLAFLEPIAEFLEAQSHEYRRWSARL